MTFALHCLLLLTIQLSEGIIQEASNYWVLQPNVVVVKVNLAEESPTVKVPLQCGDAYMNHTITWMRNGALMEQQGNQINGTVEEMFGANYTCHNAEGSILNHTLVLVQSTSRKILKQSDDADYIKCSSQNYNGAFQCSWNWSPGRNGDVVLITAERSLGPSNITCSLDENRSSVSCLDQIYCPYAEEVNHINLAVYVKNLYRLEEYSTKFYITQIVKPDKIKITKTEKHFIEWDYPGTWSGPESYFPLTFQVKVLPMDKGINCESKCRRHRGKVHLTQERRWPVRAGSLICVRSQDELCNSTWSEWSHNEIRRNHGSKKHQK